MKRLINKYITSFVYGTATLLSFFAVLSVNSPSALYIYKGEVPEELLKQR
ncbi:cyclic lactone autoinducer peptide [Paenibacillus crassostreae]|nr:cyclic lactone autoinducer peptide [Paenibacillus crassostreae]